MSKEKRELVELIEGLKVKPVDAGHYTEFYNRGIEKVVKLVKFVEKLRGEVYEY